MSLKLVGCNLEPECCFPAGCCCRGNSRSHLVQLSLSREAVWNVRLGGKVEEVDELLHHLDVGLGIDSASSRGLLVHKKTEAK